MATFTLMLGDVIESGKRIWDADDPYPIFDEEYRDPLNKKIQEHYWFYEIGHETLEMFTFALNRKMREIMPYFNQLYESAQLTVDPFQTMDVTEDTDVHNASTGDSTSTSTAASRAVTSDTPQVRLSGDEDYASNAADSNSKTDVNGTSEGTTDVDGSRHTKGSQGHQAALLMAYRQSILNIDLNVIAELETLFMSVWDNGDEFAASQGVYYGYWPYYGFGSL